MVRGMRSAGPRLERVRARAREVESASRGRGCHSLVDVRDDTTARNRRLDERVELLVAADGELQVPRRDALHLQLLRRVSGKLEHFGRQVLEDGGCIDGGRRADTLRRLDARLQETVNTADRELIVRGREIRRASKTN